MSSPAPAIGSRSALDRVFGVLEERGLHPRRSPRSVVAQCPAHSDSTAADFNARWVPSRGGQVRLACQECSAEQIVLLDALGLQAADLLDSPDGIRVLDRRQWPYGRRSERGLFQTWISSQNTR